MMTSIMKAFMLKYSDVVRMSLSLFVGYCPLVVENTHFQFGKAADDTVQMFLRS